VADEIRSLIENGNSASLLQALERIGERNLGKGDFGRAMNAVIVTLLDRIYPDVQAILPQSDPPRTHPYTRILREAAAGIYCAPPRNSPDYLELVLPFLAYLDNPQGGAPGRGSGDRPPEALAALPDLRRAEEINPRGVLAPYFTGLIHEWNRQGDDAAEAFARAYKAHPDFYLAALGFARYLNSQGEIQEEIDLLSALAVQYPYTIAIKRQLALAYYNNRDWARAEPAIAEILQRNSRDGQLILMQAHLLVEQGRFPQAQSPLDAYSVINPNNRLYLFLRARVQAEGYRNREGALNYLRSILRASPDDEEVSVYAARLLMESNRSEDQAEGREILRRHLAAGGPAGEHSLPVIGLAVQDAIYREAWGEARPYLDQLLARRRSPRDILSAYTVERGLGNRAAALSYARELYEADPSNEEGLIAYISALIDIGRRSEASALLETRLAAPAGAGGGSGMKSRYYYLRSRLRANEEAVINDLRSSLFEDPRNLPALTALFEIYHRRKDERRAVYYLKQALALAPDNVQLKRYEAEYAGAVGGLKN
jgi:predicted Zn-dependent protease